MEQFELNLCITLQTLTGTYKLKVVSHHAWDMFPPIRHPIKNIKSKSIEPKLGRYKTRDLE